MRLDAKQKCVIISLTVANMPQILCWLAKILPAPNARTRRFPACSAEKIKAVASSTRG